MLITIKKLISFQNDEYDDKINLDGVEQSR